MGIEGTGEIQQGDPRGAEPVIMNKGEKSDVERFSFLRGPISALDKLKGIARGITTSIEDMRLQRLNAKRRLIDPEATIIEKYPRRTAFEPKQPNQLDERPADYRSAKVPSTQSAFMEGDNGELLDEAGQPVKLADRSSFFDKQGNPKDLSVQGNVPKNPGTSGSTNSGGSRVQLFQDDD